METFANYFLMIILIAIIYMYFESQSYEVVYVTSKVDGRRYLVRNLPDKEEAAKLLSDITERLSKLVDGNKGSSTAFIYSNLLFLLTLSRIPNAKKVIQIDVPPVLINGKGCPVTGNS